MGKLVELTDLDFDARVAASDVPVLVEFQAAGCWPCRALAPVLEELDDDYRGRLLVAHMDVDVHPRIARSFGIRSVPTLVLFKDGAPVDGAQGLLPKESLVEMVEPHLGGGPRR